MRSRKIIDMDFKSGAKGKVKYLKRKAKVIKDIAVGSTMVVLEDRKTHKIAVTIGVIQGLKYGGSLKRGVKGGLAMYGTLIGVNIIQNIVHNRDVIKNA